MHTIMNYIMYSSMNEAYPIRLQLDSVDRGRRLGKWHQPEPPRLPRRKAFPSPPRMEENEFCLHVSYTWLGFYNFP